MTVTPDALSKSITTLIHEVSLMRVQVTDVEKKVDEMKEMSEAWNAVKTGGKAVKWVSALFASLAALWYFVKHIFYEALK